MPFDAFDALYRASDDPWSTADRWYEQRKRGLVMALLPSRRFANAYEAGCGNGNLSIELAARCDVVEASDASAEALRRARARPSLPSNLTFVRHVLPDEWPARAYALIVLSEVLYFLSPSAIDRVARSAAARARTHDAVVACDWRAPIEGHALTGDAAHRRFGDALGLPKLAEYVDADMVVTVWSRDVRSIAQREGIC